MAAIAAEVLPDVPVSLSHVVLPEMQEYERTLTTVANAAVRPLVGRYVAQFARQARSDRDARAPVAAAVRRRTDVFAKKRRAPGCLADVGAGRRRDRRVVGGLKMPASDQYSDARCRRHVDRCRADRKRRTAPRAHHRSRPSVGASLFARCQDRGRGRRFDRLCPRTDQSACASGRKAAGCGARPGRLWQRRRRCRR